MKPILEDVFGEKEHVIKADKYSLPYFKAPFHYHPEYEITFIIKSEGNMYIGEKTFPFTAGDLTFIGPSIPHVWINSKDYLLKSKTASAIVIQFSKNLFSRANLRSRELTVIANMLENSNRGIKFKPLSDKTIKILYAICAAQVEERFLTLVKLLTNLGGAGQYDLLLNEQDKIKNRVSNKHDKLLTFIYNHSQDVTLSGAAEYMGMNKSSLCRYIKNLTNQTFSGLVNKIRIKNACILLRETDLDITQIAYETGYSSASYFIRIFKKDMQKSPGEYRNTYLQPN